MTKVEAIEFYKYVKRDIFLFLVCWLVVVLSVQFLLNRYRIGFDDTDGEERSGMRPMVDARTGCQYLRVPSGGITPRIKSDGSQLCGETP